MEQTTKEQINLKAIYKDDSASINAQIDLFLADILKQVANIIEELIKQSPPEKSPTLAGRGENF